MNSELESKILCQGLGQLAGPIGDLGACWTARRLPSDAHEMLAHAQVSATELFVVSFFVLLELGKCHSELPFADGLNETSTIVTLN